MNILTNKWTYYNEFDPKIAAWLRQLIKNGDISPGEVDERSIIDVEPSDVKGFIRANWFAGIGTWDYCLTNAGWEGEVWTASLPCQSFSAAGKQLGKKDERHLLPHFIELVRQCKPQTIFGEQVEAAIRHEWADDLVDELNDMGYETALSIIPAAALNKAHIRSRIYWVANKSGVKNEPTNKIKPGTRSEIGVNDRVGNIQPKEKGNNNSERIEDSEDNSVGKAHIRQRLYWVAHSINKRSQRRVSGRQDSERENIHRRAGCDSTDSRMGNTDSDGCKEGGVDWLYCRDKKYRPIKTGIRPLVRTVKPSAPQVSDGIAGGVVYSSDTIIEANASAEARTIRLKGYGNAITAPVATEFIRAEMEVINTEQKK